MRLKINYLNHKLLLNFDSTLLIKEVISILAQRFHIDDVSRLCLKTEDDYIIDEGV